MLTGEAIRAARALARQDQRQLAQASGLSLETIKRLESIRGVVNANVRSLQAITDALSGWGVVIERLDEGGVCVRYVSGGETPRGSPPQRRTIWRPRADPPQPHRLIYRSVTGLRGEADLGDVLDDILSASLRRNSQLDVSGALLASDGWFLQALEGDKAAVQTIFGSIAADPRHRDIQVLESRSVDGRRFANWVMCARQAGRGGDPRLPGEAFSPDQLSPQAALALLLLLAEFEERALGEELAPTG